MSRPERRPYPLYDTTFTLHRLSPLYISTSIPLETAVLQHHARRFRELLVGDVLRGVRVGLENDALTAAGVLNKVAWRLLPQEDAWEVQLAEDETRMDETTTTIESNRGILVTVEYERNTYTAILLSAGEGVEDGFQHFPLLMTKMPGSLREVFVDYLSTAFDAHISLLRVSSRHIINVFEKYVVDIVTTGDGDKMEQVEANQSLRKIVQEVEVFIGFDLPESSGALKTIEVHLTREDVPRLLAIGKKVTDPESSSPFMEALATYTQSHLALDLKNDKVKIVRVACGAFVLGLEGKIKLTSPTAETHYVEQQLRASANLINELIALASERTLAKKVP